MGPTASGKTASALALAERFPIEIISVDSGMIYRGMDIGTAKPTRAEQALAPHHLIDILDPPEVFSAAEFCTSAQTLIDAAHLAGKIPLLVGGTMMYFNALQKGMSVLPDADAAIRAQLVEQALQIGWPALHDELMRIDPVCAKRIHPHDTQRIQRALEVFYLTKQPLSVLQAQLPTPSAYEFVNIQLLPEDRAWLHERIVSRFALMLEQGFLAEVEELLQRWPLTLTSPALRAVGYRQAYHYLVGEYDYATFCEKAVAATRQLAKRQLTWLRHWPNGYPVACDIGDTSKKVMAIIQEMLDN
jgi:tRNA dimethylallyltransferase